MGNLPSRSIQYPQYRRAEKDQEQSILQQQQRDPQVWQYSQPHDLQRLQYNQLPDLQQFQYNQNLIKLYQQLEEPQTNQYQNNQQLSPRKSKQYKNQDNQKLLSRQIYQHLLRLKYENRRQIEDKPFDLMSVPSEQQPVRSQKN